MTPRLGAFAKSAVVLLATFGSPVLSGAVDAATKVTAARAWEHATHTRLVLEMTAPVEFDMFTLIDPLRLVIDFPEVKFTLPRALLGSRPVGTIGEIRYGLFAPGKSRVVLDLDGPARVKRAFLMEPTDEFAYRFVLDLEATDRDSFAKQARFNRPKPPAEAAWAAMADTKAPMRADGKHVVVIDAGHGGIDPGAVGSSGKHEKEIALEAALELAAKLRRSGRYHVVLTRDRDMFLPLRERVAIARRAGAALLLSLHADSIANRTVRGAHVYSLSKRASDAEAAALAAKENKSDVIAGLDLAAYSTDVHTILLDLSQRETNNTSAELARRMVDGLRRGGVRSLNRPHRQAGFAVLKAPDVPSVLIELGFLSNRQDEALLQTEHGRAPILDAIAYAVDDFFTERLAQARQ